MKVLKSSFLEFLIVGVGGILLGYAANGLRASDSVKLTRNYFASGEPQVESANGAGGVVLQDRVGHDAGVERAGAGESRHAKHSYQRITFEEVVAVFEDPATASGAAVFVDARNDQAYQSGHIPGAIQADHYRIEEYIDAVLDAAETADKVIVYCNGGNCEDSIYMCKNLVDFEVPYDKIYLYEGGWNEWESKGQPTE